MIVPEGYAELRSSIYLSPRHNETGKDRYDLSNHQYRRTGPQRDVVEAYDARFAGFSHVISTS